MKKIPTFLLGTIVGVTLTAGTAVGAATFLKANPKTVKIVVGSNQKSVEAMNVQNKLYIPVRDAGDSFGYSVSGVTSSTVTFNQASSTGNVGSNANKPNTSNNSTVTNNTSTNNIKPEKAGAELVENLHDKYSTDGKLDAKKVALAIAAKEISINAQNKDDGNSLLHYVVLEDNFAVYSVIKLNDLNVNLQNSEGQTPLMLATLLENNFYFGELTTTYKADATIKNNEGKQAIDLAEKGKSYYIELRAYMM
ncbi:ankyrin repeat domain-containing protein [Paenibacillus odorifer]|uniref:ankyrin repeat domain-containing protein n=1 Tax=Paenibacillus odorifer TaxID=189426 RepID=UPI00096D7CFB|nr:ankyrin repeat domain-containing protein [Paenibacillus odorifer]OMD75293.1 hypothetical protein BSK50_19020 [Paenibacillus odorifer]